jgi:hypothetical protein
MNMNLVGSSQGHGSSHANNNTSYVQEAPVPAVYSSEQRLLLQSTLKEILPSPTRVSFSSFT